MKIQVNREALARLPLLNLLPPERLDAVLQHAQIAMYAKRAVILSKGQTADQLGYVLTGKLQAVDHLPDGREVGLNLIETGQFFGELLVVDRHPRSASVVAVLPSHVLWLPGEVARRMFFDHPPVAEAMLQHFAQLIRRMSDLRAAQALPNAFQRVFALLHYLKEKAPGGLEQIDNMPTHQEISIMINSSRETVTRAIAVLINANIVQKDMRRLIIRFPDRLKALVEDANRKPGDAQ
ncbi:MAG: Crp/Fnr family transcriptional regulator [Sterolibacterium sp.]|nr:Crp/Fnr family transcriptional regulator [Sterolibacterium sp.]